MKFPKFQSWNSFKFAQIVDFVENFFKKISFITSPNIRRIVTDRYKNVCVDIVVYGEI